MNDKFEQLVSRLEILVNKLENKFSENAEDIQVQVNVGNSYEKLIELLHSPAWPEAVPAFLLCDPNNEDEKYNRAEGVLGFLGQNITGKSLLDFGCGEGHVVKKAKELGASRAVGYDLEKYGNLVWENDTADYFLTSNFDNLTEKFDQIILFDVLDHIKDSAQIDTLIKVKKLLKDDGKVFVRCHPWCGRHGGHLYQQLNKAYLHIIFTDEELNSMGIYPQYVEKVKYPIITYTNWFNKAGFRIVNKDVTKNVFEPFFLNTKAIYDILMKVWEKERDFPKFQLEQCFIDFNLSI